MNLSTSRRSPFQFFVLVFALSLPFYLAGALTRVQLLPSLPVSSLMASCPLMAALILVYRENKTAGVTALLKRSFDYKRISANIWYAPIVLMMPGVMVLAYGLMRWMDMPLPAPQFPVMTALLMFLAFFIGALGEELGWSGYVIDPMQDRWGALRASIVLGLIWAAWHVIPYVQLQRSVEWIAWYGLFTVATRVILVWIFNNTGKSVFGTALFHAMVNISWFLFPNAGSHFDPRVAGLIVTFTAVIIAVMWGPRTLSKFRNPGLGQLCRQQPK